MEEVNLRYCAVNRFPYAGIIRFRYQGVISARYASTPNLGCELQRYEAKEYRTRSILC